MSTFLFDIDDTLYDQVMPFAKACDSVFCGRYKVDIEQLFVQSRKHSDEVYEASLRGEMTMDDMHVYRIQKAFEDFQIYISREEALAFQQEYSRNQDHIELSDVVVSMLNNCYGRAELGIITNGPAEHQWDKVRALGLTRWIPEENIFVSGVLGVAKPDRRIFEISMRQMKKGKEMYYIGDSFVNDIVGAKSAGLRTVWFNRRGHSIPEGNSRPDHIVTTEIELHEILKSLLAK